MSAACAISLSHEQANNRWFRWPLAALVVIGIHVSGAAVGMMIEWHDPLEVPAAAPPAILINLEPAMRTPPPPQRIPPQATPKIVEPEIDLPPMAEIEDLPLPLPDVQPVVEVPTKKKDEKKKKKAEPAPKKQEKPKELPKPVQSTQPPQDFKTATDAPSPTQREVEQPQVAAAPDLPVGPSEAELAARADEMNIWAGLVNEHLKKHRKYPRAAKRRNHEGAPEVSFTMDRNGYILDVTLLKSSGHESLDEEAIAMFRRAEPLPPLPRSSPDASVTRSLAITFNLVDG